MANQQVQLPNYTIYVGDQLNRIRQILDQVNASKVLLLVDVQTANYCMPRVRKTLNLAQLEVLEIAEGEDHKNLSTCQVIWDKLVQMGADRKSVLINLGGGVIGDMGGFCASTYMRGISFIQVPTTLLSQVDASIGGKVAIDYRQLKNIIGAFCDPLAVIVDPTFLETLPPRELRSGYAEIAKHALIRDGGLWLELEKQNKLTDFDWYELIVKSLQIKRTVVMIDPHEHGLRKILNFGHTIGHAVESVMLESNDKVLHGEAIAIGMITESYLSHRQSSLSKDELARISSHFLKIYGKISLDQAHTELMIQRMQMDKKNEGGKINFTLLHRIGKGQENYHADVGSIKESLKYYRNL